MLICKHDLQCRLQWQLKIFWNVFHGSINCCVDYSVSLVVRFKWYHDQNQPILRFLLILGEIFQKCVFTLFPFHRTVNWPFNTAYLSFIQFILCNIRYWSTKGHNSCATNTQTVAMLWSSEGHRIDNGWVGKHHIKWSILEISSYFVPTDIWISWFHSVPRGYV